MAVNKREYDRKYYHKNKDLISKRKRARDKRHQAKLRSFCDRVKVRYGCIDCGYNSHPRALQFDHLRDKQYNVSSMVGRTVSLEKLKSEIRKCEIRCANCHSVKTWERLNGV